MLATEQVNPYDEVETQYYQAAMGIIIEYVLPPWTYAYPDTIYTVLLNFLPFTSFYTNSMVITTMHRYPQEPCPFSAPVTKLTHLGRLMHICVTKLWSAPSHYLNQCCSIGNWALKNNFQWNCIRNSNTVIQENVSENFVWKMSTILSRRQCVKTLLN